MTDSSITLNASGGMTFDGPDAVQLYRAKLLASSLKLYARSGIIPTRGVTITKMLAFASAYTGKRYKRGEAMKAHDDVQAWAAAMMAALPISEA